MSAANANPSPDQDPAQPDLRVILVGRTGFDGVLRRDERVEVLRVRSAMEAVGELGDPIDDASPDRTAVVVGVDADPGDRAGHFVAALKLIDPHAAVLLVGGSTASQPKRPEAYDAIIAPPPGAGVEEIRRLADAVATLPRAETVQLKPPAAAAPATWAPAPPPQLQPASPAPAPMPAATQPAPPLAQSEIADTPLVHALLTGRDLILPALTLIRLRSGDSGARFVGTDEPSKAPSPPTPDSSPGSRAEPVRHNAIVFGWLVPSEASTAPLARWAAWLGSWLALAEQQNALRTAAMVDDLTGAYNRRYFDRFMKSAMEQAARQRHPLTLLVFDIDDFKHFNDRYGHSAGDEILRETVKLLRSVIRPTDKVCRIGGDEFAVIFYEPAGPRDPGSKPPHDVAFIAARFQEQVRAHRFPKLGDCAPGTLTVSGGLATFPWDGRTADELVAHADGLALKAKQDGKNAIRLGPGPGGSSRQC